MTGSAKKLAGRQRRSASSPMRALLTLSLSLGLLVAAVVALERGWLDRGLGAALHSSGLGGRTGPPWSPRFAELTAADRELLRRQRDLVNDLARRHVGTELTARSLDDLRVLQQILDSGALATDQVFELQALGVALGDVMAAQLGLEWQIFDDELGRTRVLRLGETDTMIFPTTMISKRVEMDVPFTVEELYRKTAREIEASGR